MKRRQLRKVGRIYSVFTDDRTGRTHDLYEYPCVYLPHDNGQQHQCCHHDCRIGELKLAGYHEIAAKLSANASASDWARNWGKMVYEPDRHGKDRQRRTKMARMMRAMRNRELGYADACVSSPFPGAMM